MDKYREYVRNLAENKISKEFLNSDQEHALEVFVNMFKTAKSEIRIFAASLCDNDDPNYVANNPVYIKTLSDFIENNGRLYILLNHFEKEKAKKSNLMSRLAYYINQDIYSKNINLRTTQATFSYSSDPEKKEVHFTVIDNVAYRIETDITKRTATCNFNNPTQAESLVILFDNVFKSDSESQALNLPDIFGSK